MEFTIQREALLKPLQSVVGVVERRQTLPILGNVRLAMENDNQLSITATDLEVELVAKSMLETAPSKTTEITLPGRKLLDICRALPDNATIALTTDYAKDSATIRSGRSRFTLTTLPAGDFPIMEETEDAIKLPIEQKSLRYLVHRTSFAMAQQDVRYYLNGMLLEIKEGVLRTVATDGHRLALNTLPASIIDNSSIQAIIPRKGIIELMRLLEDADSEATLGVGKSFIRITGPEFIFTSKLIDGRFPDYEKILPRGGDKSIVIPREKLKEALSRASILSNEKVRGIRVQLRPDLISIQANNVDKEEAEEELSIEYQQEDLDIGFNVSYLLDVLSTVDAEKAKITFSDPHSSILVEEHEGDGNSLFVIMPMRL